MRVRQYVCLPIVLDLTLWRWIASNGKTFPIKMCLMTEKKKSDGGEVRVNKTVDIIQCLILIISLGWLLSSVIVWKASIFVVGSLWLLRKPSPSWVLTGKTNRRRKVCGEEKYTYVSWIEIDILRNKAKLDAQTKQDKEFIHPFTSAGRSLTTSSQHRSIAWKDKHHNHWWLLPPFFWAIYDWAQWHVVWNVLFPFGPLGPAVLASPSLPLAQCQPTCITGGVMKRSWCCASAVHQ